MWIDREARRRVGIGVFGAAAVAGLFVGGSALGGAWWGGAAGEAAEEGDGGCVGQGEGPDFNADLGGKVEEGGGAYAIRCWCWCFHVGLGYQYRY